MSKYTTEVRYICETYAGLKESEGYDKVDEIIDVARTKVFDFDYPIFDEAYRPTLERKILEHFYTREIGFETVGLWKLKLKNKMDDIMPYYNKLYLSDLIEFNPLYTEDLYTFAHTKGQKITTDTSKLDGVQKKTGSDQSVASGTDKDESNRKHNNWTLFSDTPQGGIQGILDAETTPAGTPSVGRNGYLTNATHQFGDTDGSEATRNYGRTDTMNYNSGVNTNNVATSNGKANDDTDYTAHVYGYRGYNPSKSIMEYRKSLLNIDMMVIDELEDLFMMLWGVL